MQPKFFWEGGFFSVSAKGRTISCTVSRRASKKKWQWFKGIVHPKNENSVITYSPSCGWKVGWSFFSSQNTSGVSQKKRRCSILSNSCREWWLGFKQQQQKNIIKPQIASILLVQSNPSVLTPRHAKLFWKNITCAMFLASLFSVACSTLAWEKKNCYIVLMLQTTVVEFSVTTAAFCM